MITINAILYPILAIAATAFAAGDLQVWHMVLIALHLILHVGIGLLLANTMAGDLEGWERNLFTAIWAVGSWPLFLLMVVVGTMIFGVDDEKDEVW